MGTDDYLQDWSAWLRHALAAEASEYAEGEVLRARMGDEAYWQKFGEGLGSGWKLAIWAEAHVDAGRAWARCPRVDWVMLALARGGAPVAERVLVACDVARTGLRRLRGRHAEGQVAIEAAEAWASGDGAYDRVAASVLPVNGLVARLSDPSARLAARAATAPAAIVEGEEGREVAHAAHAAGPDARAVADAHAEGVALMLERRWPLTPGDGLEFAEPLLQRAWYWLQERVPVTHLTTVQRLSSYSMRWALVGHPTEPDGTYQPLHTALAERLSCARSPARMLAQLVQHLEAHARGDDSAYPFGLQEL